MTEYLLDTSTLLWLVSDPTKISDSAIRQLKDPANDLYVSVASTWEIAIKDRVGRIDAAPLLLAWDQTLRLMSIQDIPIEAADVAVAAQLRWGHRDPFDRMLVTQAMRRGLVIATRDNAIYDGTGSPILNTLP